jgi:predicted DNA-binding protein YlxM (UPF0122 family)
MTKNKLHAKCKMCGLLKTHPQLWEEVHDMVLKKGISYAKVTQYLNDKLVYLNSLLPENERISTFNKTNVFNHFNKHLKKPVDISKNLLGKYPKNVEASCSFSEKSTRIADDYFDSIQSTTDNYRKLVKMVDSLEEKLWAYEEQSRRQRMKNPEARVSLTEIESFQKSILSLMSLKLELAKLRNTSDICGNAIRGAVELAVASFVEALYASTEDVLLILKDVIPQSTISVEVIAKIRSDVGQTMKKVVPSIIEETIQKYSIK